MDMLKNNAKNIADLLDTETVTAVVEDAESIGFFMSNSLFTKGANKAPVKKAAFQKYVASSCVLGEMKCTERLMSFLENSEVIDGFDPNHEVVQSIYGELCMYILKLDKILLDVYGIKSSVDNKQIEKRSQDYLNNFYSRRERISKLQEMLNDPSLN